MKREVNFFWVLYVALAVIAVLMSYSDCVIVVRMSPILYSDFDSFQGRFLRNIGNCILPTALVTGSLLWSRNFLSRLVGFLGTLCASLGLTFLPETSRFIDALTATIGSVSSYCTHSSISIAITVIFWMMTLLAAVLLKDSKNEKQRVVGRESTVKRRTSTEQQKRYMLLLRLSQYALILLFGLLITCFPLGTMDLSGIIYSVTGEGANGPVEMSFQGKELLIIILILIAEFVFVSVKKKWAILLSAVLCCARATLPTWTCFFGILSLIEGAGLIQLSLSGYGSAIASLVSLILYVVMGLLNKKTYVTPPHGEQGH